MKFDKVCSFADVWTGSYIISYKKTFYQDKQLSGYDVTFENGYVLNIDEDEITQRDLKELIKNKTHISIEFRLEITKPTYSEPK